jgi:hypothetical protein
MEDEAEEEDKDILESLWAITQLVRHWMSIMKSPDSVCMISGELAYIIIDGLYGMASTYTGGFLIL